MYDPHKKHTEDFIYYLSLMRDGMYNAVGISADRLGSVGRMVTAEDSALRDSHSFYKDIERVQGAIKAEMDKFKEYLSRLSYPGIPIINSPTVVWPEYMQLRWPHAKTKRTVRYFSRHKRYWGMWPWEKIIFMDGSLYVGPNTFALLSRKELTIEQICNSKYNKYLKQDNEGTKRSV